MRYKSALPLRFINSAAFDKCSARKRRWRRTTVTADDGRRWTVDWFEYYLVDVAAFAFLNDFPIWFPFGFHLVFGLVVRIMYANACVCVCASVFVLATRVVMGYQHLNPHSTISRSNTHSHSHTVAQLQALVHIMWNHAPYITLETPQAVVIEKPKKKTGKVSIVLRGCKGKDNAGIWVWSLKSWYSGRYSLSH